MVPSTDGRSPIRSLPKTRLHIGFRERISRKGKSQSDHSSYLFICLAQGEWSNLENLGVVSLFANSVVRGSGWLVWRGVIVVIMCRTAVTRKKSAKQAHVETLGECIYSKI